MLLSFLSVSMMLLYNKQACSSVVLSNIENRDWSLPELVVETKHFSLFYQK